MKKTFNKILSFILSASIALTSPLGCLDAVSVSAAPSDGYSLFYIDPKSNGDLGQGKTVAASVKEAIQKKDRLGIRIKNKLSKTTKGITYEGWKDCGGSALVMDAAVPVHVTMYSAGKLPGRSHEWTEWQDDGYYYVYETDTEYHTAEADDAQELAERAFGVIEEPAQYSFYGMARDSVGGFSINGGTDIVGADDVPEGTAVSSVKYDFVDALEEAPYDEVTVSIKRGSVGYKLNLDFNGGDFHHVYTDPDFDSTVTDDWEYEIGMAFFGNEDNGKWQGAGIEKVLNGEVYKNTRFYVARDGYEFLGWTGSNGDVPEKTVSVTGREWELSYTANWAKTCEVTFDANGGKYADGETTKTVKTLGSVNPDTDIESPERTGFLFKGWGSSADATTPVDLSKQLVTDDTTFYAVWKDTRHTVTLNADIGKFSDNSKEKTLTVEHGNTISPEEPTCQGHRFLGWNYDGAEINMGYWNITNAVTQDISLKADYAPEEYTVTLNANGGTVSKNSVKAVYAQPYSLPVPVRNGYQFLGWFTSASGGTKIEDGSTVSILSDTPLFARWDLINYTISYAFGDGGYEDPNHPLPKTYNYETGDLEIPALIWDNDNTFEGWMDVSDNVVYNPLIIRQGTYGNKKYRAKWKRNSITLTLDPNGGVADSFLPTGWIENGGKYSIEISTNHGTATIIGIAKPTVIKTGYSFDGWYNDKGQQPGIAIGKDSEFKAKWTPITYNVKFNANGGTGSMENQAFTYGKSQNLQANSFSRTNYSFRGWATYSGGPIVYYDGQSVSNLSSTDGGTVTLYAVWKKTYTVTYLGNGGSGSMAGDVFVYGVNKQLSKNKFTRNGYLFAGWSKSQTATTATYTDQQAVSNLTSTAGGVVKLYAVWVAPITATFYANGGKYTDGKTVKAVNVVTGGYANPSEIPTRDGYTFKGWAENAGSNASVIDLSTTAITSNRSFYAVWEATPSVELLENEYSTKASNKVSYYTLAPNQQMLIPYKLINADTVTFVVPDEDKDYLLVNNNGKVIVKKCPSKKQAKVYIYPNDNISAKTECTIKINEHRVFDIEKDGLGFVNDNLCVPYGYYDNFTFDSNGKTGGGYQIPADRIANLFGKGTYLYNRYVITKNGKEYGPSFGGNCEGMSILTSILYNGYPLYTKNSSGTVVETDLFNRLCQGSAIQSKYSSVFNKSNMYLTNIIKDFAKYPSPYNYYFPSATPEEARLVEIYQLWGNAYVRGGLADSSTYVNADGTHNKNGSFAQDMLDKINNAYSNNEVLLAEYVFNRGTQSRVGHAIIITPDRLIATPDNTDGWVAVPVWDPNYPHYPDYTQQYLNSITSSGTMLYNSHYSNGYQSYNYQRYLFLNSRKNLWALASVPMTLKGRYSEKGFYSEDRFKNTVGYRGNVDGSTGMISSNIYGLESIYLYNMNEKLTSLTNYNRLIFDGNPVSYAEFYARDGLASASTSDIEINVAQNANGVIYDASNKQLATIADGQIIVPYQYGTSFPTIEDGQSSSGSKATLTNVETTKLKVTLDNGYMQVGRREKTQTVISDKPIEIDVDISDNTISVSRNSVFGNASVDDVSENDTPEVHVKSIYGFEDGSCQAAEAEVSVQEDETITLGVLGDEVIADSENGDFDVTLIRTGEENTTAKASVLPDEMGFDSEFFDYNGHTYEFKWTGGVAYDARKHVSNRTSSTKNRKADLYTCLTVDGKEVKNYSLKIKGGREAGKAVISIKTKDKELRKAFRGRKFAFDVTPAELTLDNLTVKAKKNDDGTYKADIAYFIDTDGNKHRFMGKVEVLSVSDTGVQVKTDGSVSGSATVRPYRR